MSQSRVGGRRYRRGAGRLRHLLRHPSRNAATGGPGRVLAPRVRPNEHGPSTQEAGDGLLLRGPPPPSDAALAGKLKQAAGCVFMFTFV